MTLSVLVKMCGFLRKVCFKLKKLSVRSQKRSQKSCLTMNCQSSLLTAIVRQLFWDCFWDPKNCAWTSSLLTTIVMQHFWDIFWDPKHYAWQLAVQDMSRVNGQLIVRQNFLYPRNDAWRLSDDIFGIIRHHFWDLELIFRVQKEAKQRNKGCFRAFKRDFCNLLCQSVL